MQQAANFFRIKSCILTVSLEYEPWKGSRRQWRNSHTVVHIVTRWNTGLATAKCKTSSAAPQATKCTANVNLADGRETGVNFKWVRKFWAWLTSGKKAAYFSGFAWERSSAKKIECRVHFAKISVRRVYARRPLPCPWVSHQAQKGYAWQSVNRLGGEFGAWAVDWLSLKDETLRAITNILAIQNGKSNFCRRLIWIKD